MAKKRMFSLDVVDTDLFLDMPQSARLLYYDLGMRADDDGFVDDHKKIMRCTGASIDDLKLLIMKCFIIPFDSGVCVIRHWRINNYLRTDRYSETQHKEEKRSLLTDENNAYFLNNGIPEVDQLGDNLDTQVRLGKDRLELDKDRLDNFKKDKEKIKQTKKFISPTLDEIKDYCKSRNSSVDPVKFYDFYTADPDKQWIDSNGKHVNSWKQKILTWESRTKVTQKIELSRSESPWL